MTIIIIIIVVVVIIAGALVFVASRMPDQNSDPLESRLAEFTQRGEPVSLEEIEMSAPFAERVIYPALKKFGELSARFTPQNAIQDISKKLELAGNPPIFGVRMDASTLLASRFVFAAILAIGVFFIASYLKQSTQIVYGGGLFGGVLGFLLPQSQVDNAIKKRQKEIRVAMPDALDLLTICVEAGLGFEAAMSKVAEKWDNELSAAFGRGIREMQLGKPRRDALRDMSERIDLPEMTSFVAAVIQGQELGVSMAKVLRIQSDQMRMKRRQRAEEEARQAPIKMLIPMTVFIFPSIFIVLMTPAGIRLMNSGLAGI